MSYELNLPKRFVPVYNAVFFRGYYKNYDVTDIQMQDILKALSDARGENADIRKKLGEAHDELNTLHMKMKTELERSRGEG